MGLEPRYSDYQVPSMLNPMSTIMIYYLLGGMNLSDNPIKTSDPCFREIHIYTIFIINFTRFMGLLHYIQSLLNQGYRTSLVAQWLGIRLPMQGTQVWSLVQEDPTCRRATKPVHQNYWARALQLMSHNYWAHVPQQLKPTCLEPVLHNKRSHRNEKPAHHNKE